MARLLQAPLFAALGVSLSCAGAAVGPTASNSAKLGEAAAFAGVAAAAQVAESVMEQRARNNAPVHGATVTPSCDNDRQYACVEMAGGSTGDPRPPEREMTTDEARDYVLGYVNGVRKLNELPPVVRDPEVDAVAEESARSLSEDHRPGQYAAEHRRSGREAQGPPEGTNGGLLQDQLGGVLVGWMKEGSGGVHHDLLLRNDWRRLGVGIAERSGRTYLALELEP